MLETKDFGNGRRAAGMEALRMGASATVSEGAIASGSGGCLQTATAVDRSVVARRVAVRRRLLPGPGCSPDGVQRNPGRIFPYCSVHTTKPQRRSSAQCGDTTSPALLPISRRTPQVHDRDDLDESGLNPVDHAIGEMRYPALTYVALHPTVRLWMALNPAQRVFETVQKTPREAELFILVEHGRRVGLRPGFSMPTQVHSGVFSAQFVDDHRTVEQRGFPAIDLFAAAPDFLQPLL